jgi:hypothetical protein
VSAEPLELSDSQLHDIMDLADLQNYRGERMVNLYRTRLGKIIGRTITRPAPPIEDDDDEE